MKTAVFSKGNTLIFLKGKDFGYLLKSGELTDIQTNETLDCFNQLKQAGHTTRTGFKKLTLNDAIFCLHQSNPWYDVELLKEEMCYFRTQLDTKSQKTYIKELIRLALDYKWNLP